MKTLLDPSVVVEMKQRLTALHPGSGRQWGKMDVAQALAHCSAGMEMALGDKHPPRLLIGRIIGPLFRSAYSNEKPMQPGSPTHPSLVVKDQRDFARERERLGSLIERFSAGGAKSCTTHPHPFFGKLTAAEWGSGMYKHLDHHLRQFGV
jgi:hypothetical protein